MENDLQYKRRIQLAVGVSLAVHACLFLLGAVWRPAEMGEGPVPDYVVLEIEPEPAPAPQLVEALSPTDTPPEDARFIARENSQAADAELKEGNQLGPAVDIESELETPGQPAVAVAPTAPLAVQQAPAPEPAPQPEDPLPPQPQPSPRAEKEPAAEGPNAMRDRDAPVSVSEPPARESARTADMERMKMAQAVPPATTPDPLAAVPASPARGRLDNRVVTKGFTSYGAIQDKIAPYLEHVKKKVERRWREALLLRYSGTEPRGVEVDCEIAADGTLVSVKLAAPAEDAVYGALCLDAIRGVAPFDKFPFEVPEIYRNQNLEIRWHFRFL